MKNSRRIDDIGRVAIPKEMREKLGINEADSLNFTINEREEIIIRQDKASSHIVDCNNT